MKSLLYRIQLLIELFLLYSTNMLENVYFLYSGWFFFTRDVENYFVLCLDKQLISKCDANRTEHSSYSRTQHKIILKKLKFNLCKITKQLNQTYIQRLWWRKMKLLQGIGFRVLLYMFSDSKEIITGYIYHLLRLMNLEIRFQLAKSLITIHYQVLMVKRSILSQLISLQYLHLHQNTLFRHLSYLLKILLLRYLQLNFCHMSE